MIKYLIAFFGFAALFFTKTTFAQNPVNWTPAQLMEPAELAHTLKASKNVPVIISVGPSAIIPGSVDIGMTQEAENLNKLKTSLKNKSKKEAVVIYCGCCPFEHCPNVRPAIATLKEMGFTNYKLLNLPKNIKTNWIDKGYPIADQ